MKHEQRTSTATALKPRATNDFVEASGHPLMSKRHTLKTCLICKSARVYYLFSAADYRVVRCNDCGLVFLNPQPSDAELSRIYGTGYFIRSDTPEGRQSVSEMKQATARLYLDQIRRYSGLTNGRLLEIGCGEGDFLVAAESAGWRVTGIDFSQAACDTARS